MAHTASLALAAALLAPPAGRPPTGPLERYEPRLYDVAFDVVLNARIPHRIEPYGAIVMELTDTPIAMPLIFQGAYSRVEPTSVVPRLWFGTRLDETLPQRFRIEEGYAHNGHLAIMQVDQFRGQTLRWNMALRAHAFSSRIDEDEAAGIPWPREWPPEVADGLLPQTFVESDAPVFAETVERISGGKLRLASPYLAAKDLVRHCVNEVQVTGNGLNRGAMGVIQGMVLQGAAATARQGRGSPHDLVCVCIAMLRAAGLPARPVIGVYEDDEDRSVFVSWGEFYLPDAGWVPFDPVAMRGKGIRTRDVRQPWPEFGSLDELNRRIPLGYHYVPTGGNYVPASGSFVPASGVVNPSGPAVWGWAPQPEGAREVEQLISISITSRGRGADDPE